MVVSPHFLGDSTNIVVDQLSDVFDLVEVRSLVAGGFAASGPWVSGGPIHDPLKFIAVVDGRARLSADGVDGPYDLESGDVVVLNNRAWLEVVGGTGPGLPREVVPEPNFSVHPLAGTAQSTQDVILGGHVSLNPSGQTLLLQALPPVAHVRASAAEATNLRGTIYRLFKEVTGNRIGSAFATRQYGQLLLLEVLRAYIDQAELPPGWLRVLTDERLAPALSLMHAEPGKAWRLDELARAAAMSRTSFAERFRTLAGVPPLTYLNRWRMLLAQRALRDENVRIGPLAFGLGYTSESAFSTAFKREVGESPMRYRYRVRSDEHRRVHPTA